MTAGAANEAKDALRAELLAARRARPAAALAAARSAVASHVLARRAAEGWRVVAAYEPLRTEPGSVELLAGLRAAGVRVLVPLTRPDRDLDWTEWTPQRTPDPLATSSGELGAGGPGAGAGGLGVDAITGADAVLVPALAVGRDGTRLGRGRGCYDRALPRARGDAVLAAVVFADELRDAVPADPWDVPVGFAVTPDGWRHLPC